MDVIQPLSGTQTRSQAITPFQVIIALIILGGIGYAIYYIIDNGIIPGLGGKDDVTTTAAKSSGGGNSGGGGDGGDSGGEEGDKDEGGDKKTTEGPGSDTDVVLIIVIVLGSVFALGFIIFALQMGWFSGFSFRSDTFDDMGIDNKGERFHSDPISGPEQVSGWGKGDIP